MVRPRWIGALVFALIVAGGFAWLGQWQLSRAIASGTVVEQPVETTVPLSSVAKPAGPIHDVSVGQLVTTKGTFVSDDYVLISGRLNDGPSGYWVVGRLTVDPADAGGDAPLALAVARGFAADRTTADHALQQLRSEPAQQVTVTGRILPTEEPNLPTPKQNPNTMTMLSVAQLVNVWPDIGDANVYEAYVVEHGTPPAGLTPIFSPPPIEQQTIDWLNVFYAAEWAIFAGFAVFLWYRLVRDTWERETEDYEEALAVAAGPAAAASGQSRDNENVD